MSHYHAINDHKPEIFVAGIPQQLNKSGDIYINVGNSSLQPSLKIRNLAIIFDSKLTFVTIMIVLIERAFLINKKK